ncbi:hypothetical protein DAPPUDRAFT_233714 [Daphnia pulex]|uniref:Uncharacterized protein n=1 Tax=Daphnia pulex TaxID=6669 RepID=E9FVJ2_DAPPU|nr:hypothetical protein DAPPUDRAFT_233714 [Daphnia pulex]|eukprot:EFX88563.1 hypothetical protein DAPPUDRAFT_233714 [Daphnia pulex]
MAANWEKIEKKEEEAGGVLGIAKMVSFWAETKLEVMEPFEKKKGETTSRVGGVKYVTLGLPLASKPSGPKMIFRLSGRIKKSSEPITPDPGLLPAKKKKKKEMRKKKNCDGENDGGFGVHRVTAERRLARPRSDFSHAATYVNTFGGGGGGVYSSLDIQAMAITVLGRVQQQQQQPASLSLPKLDNIRKCCCQDMGKSSSNNTGGTYTDG